MIKTTRYIYQKVVTASRIKHLNIVETGHDSDGDPFVKLADDIVFFGPKTAPKERKFYSFLLSSRTKKILPFDCFQVAMDIVVRYQEGNLKWGGPAKEAFYKVKENDMVAEMGAFRGYYTLYLAQKVGKKGKVIAIEPIPANLTYLRKNIEMNHLDNVVIVPKGVWNENKTMSFQRKSTDFQSGSIDIEYQDSEDQSIEVNTLDKILDENDVANVNLMLIQLNGAEMEALDGLTKIKPENLSIAARYDKNGRIISKEIDDLLKERGYTTRILEQKFVYGKLN